MTKRIEFEFSADAVKRIDYLKERTNAHNYGCAVRNAIRIYEWILELDKNGLNAAAIKNGEIINIAHIIKNV